MIAIWNKDHRHAPIFVCDICGDMISSADEGAAVFNTDTKLNEKTPVTHAHKDRCLDIAEERMGRGFGWQELGAQLVWIANNIEVDKKRFAELADFFGDGDLGSPPEG